MPITLNTVLQFLVFLALVALITKPFGLYLVNVFSGQRNWLSPVLRPVEHLFYRIAGVKEEEEQGWLSYTVAMLIFSVPGLLLTYLILRTQQWHGSFFNPQGLGPVEPGLAWNTAVSFTTNTNWQNYGGEQTMSYFSQAVGLAVTTQGGILVKAALKPDKEINSCLLPVSRLA